MSGLSDIEEKVLFWEVCPDCGLVCRDYSDHACPAQLAEANAMLDGIQRWAQACMDVDVGTKGYAEHLILQLGMLDARLARRKEE